MKKKKSEIDLYVLISDPNQQHGSRADIMFVKAACFSVAALVISEFGIEEKEKKNVERPSGQSASFTWETRRHINSSLTLIHLLVLPVLPY